MRIRGKHGRSWKEEREGGNYNLILITNEFKAEKLKNKKPDLKVKLRTSDVGNEATNICIKLAIRKFNIFTRKYK